MADPRKPYYRRKNLADISYTDQVIVNSVPKFVAMATGVDRGKCDLQHSMAHPRKPPYRCKNFAKISYASQVIAHFVPHFIAMATGVGRGKMQLAAFDGASPKIPLEAQKFSQKSLTQAELGPILSQISLPWQRGSVLSLIHI